MPSFTGGVFQLRVTGITNNDHVRVQGSADLRTWATITDLVANGTEAVYIDPQSETLPNRYYRTLLNP